MTGKNFVNHLLFVAVIFIFTVPALADPPLEKLNFHEALEQAYQSNPKMIEARKSIEGSKGDLITARTLAALRKMKMGIETLILTVLRLNSRSIR